MRFLVPLWLVFAWAAASSAQFAPYTHPVMTWAPPYAVKKTKAWLIESAGNTGVADGLTHLALQFWTPTPEGGVTRVDKFEDVGDATVAEFRTWAHAHGIRVMLCVYNGAEKWDWPLARAAFAGHPEAFADALLKEMERLELDGIDLDLEGNGAFDADKSAFVAFTQRLAKLVHAVHKQVTVDTFAYRWNAPNQTWWKELLPLVDGLTTMGYEETGAHSEDWRAYEAQKAAAAPHADKLMMGLPTHQGQWQGAKALDHLRWLRDNGVGAALWDATCAAPTWRTPEVWDMLRQICTGK